MAHGLTTMLGAIVACGVLLAGCGSSGSPEEPEPSTELDSSSTAITPESGDPEMEAGSPEPESSPPAPETTEAEPTEAEAVSADPAAVTQEETCDWDTGRTDPSGDAPTSPGDADLSSVLVGAWQHTHIDSGSGFEALETTTDIRYIFPSTSRLLYCQDVKGATTQAEQAADIELAGTDIIVPGGAPGYAVKAWDSDTMVWTNNLDGSLYLLQRR